MRVEQSTAKRSVLERLLEQGMVLVTLDARVDGVAVPTHLKSDAQLRLNLSHRFGLPMECKDDEIVATLTFGGTPFECRLPWGAIYMFVSHATGQPFLFPSDIPQDANPFNAPGAPIERPKTAPALKVVGTRDADDPSGDEPAADAEAAVVATDTSDGTDASDEPPPERPRRGHLRVIK